MKALYPLPLLVCVSIATSAPAADLQGTAAVLILVSNTYLVSIGALIGNLLTLE